MDSCVLSSPQYLKTLPSHYILGVLGPCLWTSNVRSILEMPENAPRQRHYSC